MGYKEGADRQRCNCVHESSGEFKRKGNEIVEEFEYGSIDIKTSPSIFISKTSKIQWCFFPSSEKKNPVEFRTWKRGGFELGAPHLNCFRALLHLCWLQVINTTDRSRRGHEPSSNSSTSTTATMATRVLPVSSSDSNSAVAAGFTGKPEPSRPAQSFAHVVEAMHFAVDRIRAVEGLPMVRSAQEAARVGTPAGCQCNPVPAAIPAGHGRSLPVHIGEEAR